MAIPDDTDPEENVRRAYQRASNVIAAVLKSNSPQLDATSMAEMRITDQELFAAAIVIIESVKITKKAFTGSDER